MNKGQKIPRCDCGHGIVPAPETPNPVTLSDPTVTWMKLWEETKDARFRRLREATLQAAVLLVALGSCIVWAIVTLSGGYSLEVKQQVTTLIISLFSALLGVLAGITYKDKDKK